MPLKHQGFQSLLYFKFVHEKLFRVEDIAKAMGLSPSTLYNYLEGITTFPPDLIAPLYNATKDEGFLNFVTDDTDKRLVERDAPRHVKPVIEETLDMVGAAGALTEKINKSLVDGDINAAEKQKLLNAAHKVFKELEELVACLKKGRG